MIDWIPKLTPGRRLGRYELREELGRGGMGVVFKAHDPAIGRLVAVKTMRLDILAGGLDMAQASSRFAREAQAVGQLSHPNIVTLYDAQQEGDLAYLVMEFVSGQSLDALIRVGTRFSLEQVCDIGTQVCNALEHAHAQGVIHRDIKPANILVQENGQVKVTDFGVAYMAKSTLTRTGQSVGTPSYMSPEQIEGKPVDGRSDLFSLGVVLYELCSNEKAFPGDSVTTVIYRILHTDPVPLHQLNNLYPPGLDAVIRKALEKYPGQRYPRAREFREALANPAALLAGPAARATRTKRGVKTVPSSSVAKIPDRKGLLLGVAAGAAVILLGSLFWVFRSPSPPSPVPDGHTSETLVSQPTVTTRPPPQPAVPPQTASTTPAPAGPSSGTPSPRAVRVTFARDVKGVLPVDEGDTFYRDDRKVVVWVRWANVRGRHTTLTRWFNPDGELVYASPSPEPFESPAEWWTTWTTLTLGRVEGVKPGRWRVEIQFDNQPIATGQFALVDRPRPVGSPPAQSRNP